MEKNQTETQYPAWVRTKFDIVWLENLKKMKPGWVAQQRAQYKRGTLSEDRVKTLIEAGFEFVPGIRAKRLALTGEAEAEAEAEAVGEQQEQTAAQDRSDAKQDGNGEVLRIPKMKFAPLLILHWNGASIESINRDWQTVPEWVAELLRDIWFGGKFGKRYTAKKNVQWKLQYEARFGASGIKLLEEIAGTDEDQIAESLVNIGDAAAMLGALESFKVEATGTTDIPLHAPAHVRLFAFWMAAMIEARQQKRPFSSQQYQTLETVEAMKLRVQFKAGWWSAGTGFVPDSVPGAPMAIQHETPAPGAEGKAGKIEQQEKKLQHILHSFASAKNRADNLAEMLENHLNPDEENTVLGVTSDMVFKNINARYWKLLRGRSSGGQEGLLEYGMSTAQLARYMRVPENDIRKMVARRELPGPLSIFNGEKKYNLLQVAAITRGHGEYLAKSDQTKNWYAVLLGEAREKAEMHEKSVEAFRIKMAE